MVVNRDLSRPFLLVGDLQDPSARQVVESLSEQCWQPIPISNATTMREALSMHHDCTVGLFCWGSMSQVADHDLLALCANRLVSWVFLLSPDMLEQPKVLDVVAESAYDFHTYPVDPRRLAVVLGRAWGMARLRGKVRLNNHAEHADEYEMVGTSPVMLELFAQIRKVAAVDAPALVTGESGTGKELAALAIHERSSRRNGPFVPVNCGALPPTLIQAELFGYEKGAFTGAGARRIGRIESANEGTLFLDEIGDLPLELQGHLLRFLQQGEIQRLGSSSPLAVNVRVVAATNVSLEEAVAKGRFREDLYYRLNVLRLEMPPLRERGEDVPLLAKFFFDKFSAEKRPHVQGYSRQALQALIRHDWPGNVRELINRVRRALVMSDNRLLTPQDLGLSVEPAVVDSTRCNLEKARERAERETLAAELSASHGNVSVAARHLGVSRVTLYRLMEKHGLERSRKAVPGR